MPSTDRVLTQVNECYITQQDTLDEDNLAKSDPYEFILSSEGNVVKYDVIDSKKRFRKKPPKIAPYQPRNTNVQ